MKQLLVALIAVLGLAFAHSYKVLYSEELERVPATIEVVQGFNTLITAHDYVEVATLGRPELLTVTRISNSIIQLNTQASGGAFGLTLVVGGRVQQFTVRIGGGLYNRTYAIQPARSTGVVPPPPPVTNPTPAPRSAAPTPNPAAQPSAAAPAPAPAPAPTPVGAWLVARVSGGQTLPGGTYVINFSLENTSDKRVSADVARLVVRQGGRERNFMMNRLPASALIDPKGVQAGSILVQDVGPGELELEWVLVEMGDNPRTLILKRTLTATNGSE